ncbi:KdsC family phosphatase [Haliovirga abyssi]|uniref:3-deoxy-D-manno-octulosonate 8-phosphate phosphatase n=1 Tax=Haliovirga abyssi TaxID=2996794 RepID=A0AAU9D0X1_9FUSO|nr:HAD-IIIA family hydrolase [Haliovirga abyssi]BDU49616.1 3-deoxy-D-manno-octulosonate 8-phosphate phosphatase [Haliovirga abyssi]
MTENIKLIVLDVDGTLTNGTIYIGNSGEELKGFNVKDGFAIVKAQKVGYKFAIITGRKSVIVEKRAKELSINEIHQGIENKRDKLKEVLDKYNMNMKNVAYIGDDINDLPAMKDVGLVGVPYDGAQEVKKISDFISSKKGGQGAVREFIEYILRNNGDWEKILRDYK